MFDDILNCGSEKCSCDDKCCSKDEEVCPNCGSDNIGTSASPTGVQMFCVDCGHIWLV